MLNIGVCRYPFMNSVIYTKQDQRTGDVFHSSALPADCGLGSAPWLFKTKISMTAVDQVFRILKSAMDPAESSVRNDS